VESWKLRLATHFSQMTGNPEVIPRDLVAMLHSDRHELWTQQAWSMQSHELDLQVRR
jgi:hypothetical protein